MKIKSLLIMPNKNVQLVKIPANMKFIKSLIGENLIRIKLDDNTILIADKNAKIDDFNRILGKKIINGTFLIVGIKNKRRISLKKRQIRKFKNMFQLSKHEKKVSLYRNEYLKEQYINLSKENLEKEIAKKVA